MGFSHAYHPGGLNRTLLSQGYVIENGSHSVNSRQGRHSKNKGGLEDPPIARVHLMGQPAVRSFQ